MKCCEAELADALAAHVKDRGPMPEMSNDALARDYPVLYQSVLQVVHNTGERVTAISGGRKKQKKMIEEQFRWNCQNLNHFIKRVGSIWPVRLARC